MNPLTEPEITAIERNLFHVARPIVRNRTKFPWHRDASRARSSQALAVEFFETVNALESRHAVFDAWWSDLALPISRPSTIEPEYLLPKDLLGEPRPTQVDAVARCDSDRVLFECKFTEPDGGGCTQPIAIKRGKHAGLKQCDGNYSDQVNPVTGVRSRCALTGKGISYWELIQDVLDIDPESDYRPCPFVGGWYQWMRNLVAARALAIRAGKTAMFVLLYVEGPFPMAKKIVSNEWAQFVRLVAGHAVALRTTSYQRLNSLAADATMGHDRLILGELATWMERKFAGAARKSVRQNVVTSRA